MSGRPKPNYFLILAIWGSVRANFPSISYYLGFPLDHLLAPQAPIGPFSPYRYSDERVLFLSDTRRVPEVCLKLEGQAMDVGHLGSLGHPKQNQELE